VLRYYRTETFEKEWLAGRPLPRALETFGTFERVRAAGAIAHRWLPAQDYVLP
jgi:hypothetical protein